MKATLHALAMGIYLCCKQKNIWLTASLVNSFSSSWKQDKSSRNSRPGMDVRQEYISRNLCKN